jgi:hypothetical protein
MQFLHTNCGIFSYLTACAFLCRLVGADVVLDFEGVGDQTQVGSFYSSLGVFFNSNALGLVDTDAGGSGNFGGEPSADTIIYFLSGGATFMNVPAGFTTGFSFWYTSPYNTGSISVFDGVDGTGTLLATLVFTRRLLLSKSLL